MGNVRGVAIAALVGNLAGCRINFDVGGTVDATGDGQPADMQDMTASACPGNYVDVGVGTSRYRLIASPSDDWIILEAACEADGQHLVVLDSQAEADAVVPLAGGLNTWVGVTDRIVELEWRSVTNVLPSFLPWARLPLSSVDNCIEWEVGTNEIDNQSCSSGRQGICECDGLPVVAGTY